MSIRNLLLAALAVAGAPAVLAPVPAGATHRLECQAPVDLVKLSRPLARVSARLRDPDARPMVTLLARIGAEANVPVFRRFALMQHWHEAREYAFSDILAPDLFHMNDWSYSCLARNLATALLANAQASPAQPTVTTAAAAPADRLPAQSTDAVAPTKTASH